MHADLLYDSAKGSRTRVAAAVWRPTPDLFRIGGTELNNPNDVARSGRIDLHSHLLPGIDDGCATMADSVRCVERFREHGYSGTVCTPHFILSLYPHNTPAKIAQRMARLAERLHEAGIEYGLWPGAEVRIDPDTISWFEEVGIPTLGPSRTVLLDWWGRIWPDCAEKIFQYLLERGYQPVLAHPERMGFHDAELTSILDSLRKMGVRLQGNFNSLSGGEGPVAAEWARRMSRQDLYYLMASDMHHPNLLDGRFDGLRWLEAELGTEKVAQLLEERPQKIVSGVEI